MIINPNVSAEYESAGSVAATSAASTQSIIGAIRELAGNLNSQSGDVVIPVYLGGTMLDEVIVTAQQRANLRSGGR